MGCRFWTVWIFLCFSIIYILRIVYILLTWKSNVKAFIVDKYDIEETDGEIHTQTTISKMKSTYNIMVKYYDDKFDINGKYYLYILYFSEFNKIF